MGNLQKALSGLFEGKLGKDLQVAAEEATRDRELVEMYKSPYVTSGGLTNRITRNLKPGEVTFKGLGFTPVKMTVLDGATIEYEGALGDKIRTAESSTVLDTPKAAYFNSNGKTVRADAYGGNSAASAYAATKEVLDTEGKIVVQVESIPQETNGTYLVTTGMSRGADNTDLSYVQIQNGSSGFKQAPGIPLPAYSGFPTSIEYLDAQNSAQNNNKGKWKNDIERQDSAKKFAKAKEKEESSQPLRAKLLAIQTNPNDKEMVKKFAKEINEGWNKKRESNVSTVEDFFKIGDVILSVPPTHLTISQLRTSYSVPMLGNEAKPISSYHSRTIIKLNLVFAGGEIDTDLKRIMEQFKYCPFNIVRSADLFKRIVGDNSWLTKLHHSTNSPNPIPVTMDSYTIYSIEGHPFAVGCTLQLSLFNYAPYFNNSEKLKMEYYKFDLRNIETLGKLEKTMDLEDAIHPYNLDIEETLKDTGQRYGVASDNEENASEVSLTKLTSLLSSTMFDENAILDIAKFTQNLEEKMFTAIANSVSVQHHNNFAWTPVIGFSQPTAQYIGPGETYVTLNFKTENPEEVSKLLKSYNSTIEKSLFSFYDDRYLVDTPMTRFARATVCSMKELVTSSIQGHPGWTDINVIFNKNTFNADLLESNPAAEFDEFWGLKRLLNAMDNPEISSAVKKEIEDASYALGAGSILDRINQAGDKVQIRLSQAAAAGVEAVLQLIDKSPNTMKAIDTKKGRPMLVPIGTRIEGLKPLPQSLASLAVSFSEWVEKNASYLNQRPKSFSSRWLRNGFKFKIIDDEDNSSPFDIDVFGIEYPEWALRIYSLIISNDERYKSDNAKYSAPLNAGLLKGTSGSIAINWDKSTDEKKAALSTVKEVLNDSSNLSMVKEYFSPLYAIAEKGEFIQFKYTAAVENDTKAGGNTIADIFSAEGPIKRTSKQKIKTDTGVIIPKNFPKFSVTSHSEAGSYIINCAFIFDEKSDPYRVASCQAQFNKDLRSAAEFDKSREIPKNLILARPHPAHRYYPGYYNFVKYNPFESGTVGDWFMSDAKHDINEKLQNIANTVEDAISPIMDHKAWTSVYVKQRLFGQEGINEIEKNPNNPFKVMEMVTKPSSRKDVSRIVGDEIVTEMQPLPDMAWKFQLHPDQKANVDKGDLHYSEKDVPYSCTSQLLYSYGLTDKIKKMANLEYDKFREHKKKEIFQVDFDTMKSSNPQIIQMRDNMSINRAFMGVSGKSGLQAVGVATVQDINPMINMMKAEGESPSPEVDSPLTRTVKHKTVYAEQFKWVAGESDPSYLSEAQQKDRAQQNIDEPPSTKGSTSKAEKEEKQKELENNKAINKPLTENEKWAVIYSSLIGESGYDPAKLSDKLFSLISSELPNADWTVGSIGTTETQIAGFVKRAMRVVGNKNEDGKAMSEKYSEDLDKSFTVDQKSLVFEYRSLDNPEKYPGYAAMLTVKLAKEMRRINNEFALTTRDVVDAAVYFNEVQDQEVRSAMADATVKHWDKKRLAGEKSLYGSKVQAGLVELRESLRNISKQTKQVMTDRLLQSFMPTTGLQNAFPTFKLYVISSDTSEYKYYSLDDYYDFRLLQDVMVVRSKDNPAHMLKARVIVDPRYITTDGMPQQKGDDRLMPAEHRNPAPTAYSIDTEGEKFFSMGRAPLRTGMRISLRLGYHTDPRYLDTVFMGTIVGISGTMESGVYEIEAQGDGRELMAPATSSSASINGGNYREVVSQILRSNISIVHFGRLYGTFVERFSKEHYVLMGLAKAGYGSAALMGGGVIGAAGTLVIGGPAIAAGALLMAGAGSAALMFQYSAIPEMSGRLFESLEAHYKGLPSQKLNSFHEYMKGSIYDVGKASRQAGIALYEDLSYGNDPVDDNIFLFDIWSESPGAKMHINNRQVVWEVLRDIKRIYPGYALDVRPYGNRSTIFMGPTEHQYWRTDDPCQAMAPQLYETSNPNLQHDAKIRNNLYNIVDRDRFGGVDVSGNNRNGVHLVPFQKQHLVTSDADIIMNGIKSTPDRGWNAVVVAYSMNKDDLTNGKANFEELVADADIEPGSIRKIVAKLDWTDNKRVALQYAAGLLKEGVEKMYGGTLIIRGNSKVEPYDRVYVADSVNKMYGWIEVETVIHKFDNQMGYTTHIVPNMVCAINKDTFMTRGHMLRRMFYESMASTALSDVAMFAAGTAFGIGVATVSAPVSLTLMAIGLTTAAAGAIGSFNDIYKKYVPEGAETQQGKGYIPQTAHLILATNQAISFGKVGYVVGSVVGAFKAIRAEAGPGAKLTKAAVLDTFTYAGNKYHSAAAAIKTRNFVRSFNALEAAGKVGAINTLNARLLDPNFLKNAAKAAGVDYENSKVFQDAQKQFDSMRESQEKAANPKPGGRTAVAKGGINSAALKNIGTGVLKGGGVYLAIKAMESIPAAMETFCLKSMSKAAVISVSPVWSRSSLLMGGLDGWKNDDAFFHMQGVILNAKRTVQEAFSAVKNYQSLPFGTGMSSDVKKALSGAQNSVIAGSAGKQKVGTSLARQVALTNRMKGAYLKYGKTFEEAVAKANKKYGTKITVAQAMSLADHENAGTWNPSITGGADPNDIGLMQVNAKYHGPANYKTGGMSAIEKNKAFLLDPTNNINTGVDYLASKAKETGGVLTEASILAYNSGSKGVVGGGGSKYPEVAMRAADTFSKIISEGTAHAANLTPTPKQVNLMEAAYQMKGIPYVFGGKTPAGGLDCSGFTQNSFGEIGINMKGKNANTQWETQNQVGEQKFPLSSKPTPTPSPERVKEVTEFVSGLRAGDQVFFSQDGGRVTHVGIFAGNDESGMPKLIHAPATGKNVDVYTFSDYHIKNLVGAKRYKL